MNKIYTGVRSFTLGSYRIKDFANVFLGFHQIALDLFDFVELGCVLVFFLEDIFLKLEKLLPETLFHSTLILF